MKAGHCSSAFWPSSNLQPLLHLSIAGVAAYGLVHMIVHLAAPLATSLKVTPITLTASLVLAIAVGRIECNRFFPSRLSNEHPPRLTPCGLRLWMTGVASALHQPSIAPSQITQPPPVPMPAPELHEPQARRI